MRILLGLMPLALWLSGCVEQPLRPEVVGRSPALAPPDAWSLEGRVGVKTPKEGWQADIYWVHERRQDRLRLSGPFSQGLVSIIIQEDLIYVNDGEGPQLARDPDQYLRGRLGFSVPLKSLRYWVLGTPDPKTPSAVLAVHADQPQGFEQLGWRVRPEEEKSFEGYMLPGRLLIEGEGVRLKVLIDQWRPSS